MTTTTQYAILEPITDQYWSVISRDPREGYVGTVLGGGPTAATRYKAIGRNDDAVDPDAAPGFYSSSLEGAADLLTADGRARREPRTGGGRT